MNRLILLGNGFDLAHGLKTSYHDFIKWYMALCYREANDNGEYNDQLISIKRPGLKQTYIAGMKDIEELITYYHKTSFLDLISDKQLFLNGSVHNLGFRTRVKSTFLKSLLLECKFGKWVDIENFYYTKLKQILNANHGHNSKEGPINELNSSFAELILLLNKYLSSLPKAPRIQEYFNLLIEKVQKDDIVTERLTKDLQVEKFQILNFNYTPTINQYLEGRAFSSSWTINHIHGQIDSIKNPIVFGFGDELDDNYLIMERSMVNNYLTFIKSFWYFNTPQYHDLIRFIEQDDFQVFVWGHSCGLSDRTMLNMIFEHDNC